MPKIQHDLRQVMTALNASITALEKNLVDVPPGTAIWDEINAKLGAAKAARDLLSYSCCHSQTCDFEYQLPVQGA